MVYWSAESLPTKQHCGYCYLPTKQHCGYYYLPTKQYVCQDVPILEDNTERVKRSAKTTGWLRVKRWAKATGLTKVKRTGKLTGLTKVKRTGKLTGWLRAKPKVFHSQTNNLFLK